MAVTFWQGGVKNINFRFEYLREIEVILENTTACQSEAQMG